MTEDIAVELANAYVQSLMIKLVFTLLPLGI